MNLSSPPARDTPWAPVLVVLAALLSHGTMLLRDFIWDDRISREQMALQGRWLLLQPDAFGFVRPGKTLILSILDSVFGNAAVLWHAFALCTLVIASLLVWRLAREFLSPGGALVAALAYAVHPLHVEATGWISALNGTWLTVLAVGYYLLLLDNPRSPDGRRLCSLTALFLLALMMKEEAVVLPIVGLLFLWLKGERPARAHLVAMALQYLLAALFVVYTRLASADAGQQLEAMPYPWWVMSLTAPRTILSHLAWFFAPYSWGYSQQFDPTPAIYFTLFAAGWIAAIAFVVWAWRVRRSPTPPFVFLAVAVVGLLPTANLLPMGNFIFAPRYLAHAGIGLCLLLGWAWDRNPPGGFPVFVFGFWLFAAGLTSARHHLPWQSEVHLYSRMSDETRRSVFPLLLAQLHLREGRLDEARTQADLAIERDPDSADAHITRGRILQAAGRPEEALAAWGRAEEIAPQNIDLAASLGDYFDQRFSQSNNPKDFAEADRYYTLATRGFAPNSEVAYINHGLLWVLAGEKERGVAIWREGLAKFPNSPDLQRNLAIATAP